MTDSQVLIIGSGAAGLRAATDLAAHGIEVTLISRGALSDSATDWAQGGLAAVHLPNDSILSHINDTLAAGDGLCDPISVAALVRAAPNAIERLTNDGAEFDLDSAGEIDLHLEGGHNARRIWHSHGDRSGHEVENTLAKLASRRQIKVLEHSRAIGLLVSNTGQVCGAQVRTKSGIIELTANAVVLATGGIGRLWHTTTNPAISTGDGLALGLSAGAVGRDLEFMQFHPTVVAAPGGRRLHDGRQVLVSEAVRGEGAVLIDSAGTRVMAGVHPLMDLAPRDVVAAAEQAHMARIGTDHLFLDGTDFGAKKWRQKFPSILAMCLELGVDPVSEPIPVRPGAHYHCGGLATDMAGQTTIPGLYAIGEVACTGVQGANRLASNSLTEAVIMGANLAKLLSTELPKAMPHDHIVAPGKAGLNLSQIQELMTTKVSLLRTGPGLISALESLGISGQSCGVSDAELDAASAQLVARAVTQAALSRTESRGCHRRSDYPTKQSHWLRHIDIKLAELGNLGTMRELAA